MDMILKIINLFFGATPKTRFKRLIILLLVIFIYTNVNFGFDSAGKFYFHIDALDVKLNIGK